MKSKILALSKNEEFKKLLQKKKIFNKYVTIYFGNLENKDNKKLNDIKISVKCALISSGEMCIVFISFMPL